MARRNLINTKSGIILPWNPHLAKHPDMVEHTPEPAPTPAARKPTQPRRAKKAAPAAPPPSPAAATADIDDLLNGLD